MDRQGTDAAAKRDKARTELLRLLAERLVNSLTPNTELYDQTKQLMIDAGLWSGRFV